MSTVEDNDYIDAQVNRGREMLRCMGEGVLSSVEAETYIQLVAMNARLQKIMEKLK